MTRGGLQGGCALGRAALAVQPFWSCQRGCRGPGAFQVSLLVLESGPLRPRCGMPLLCTCPQVRSGEAARVEGAGCAEDPRVRAAEEFAAFRGPLHIEAGCPAGEPRYAHLWASDEPQPSGAIDSTARLPEAYASNVQHRPIDRRGADAGLPGVQPQRACADPIGPARQSPGCFAFIYNRKRR